MVVGGLGVEAFSVGGGGEVAVDVGGKGVPMLFHIRGGEGKAGHVVDVDVEEDGGEGTALAHPVPIGNLGEVAPGTTTSPSHPSYRLRIKVMRWECTPLAARMRQSASRLMQSKALR